MSRFHNRNFELLEPYDAKVSCTVLRGESIRKDADLLDIGALGLKVLKTFIPNSLRFRKELPASGRSLFRSTLFPAEKSVLRGSNIEQLTQEILTLIKLESNGEKN